MLRNSSMSIKCSADANPEDIEYQLYFKGLFIGNSSSGVFNTTVMADGVYTCVPINTVGAGDNATVSVIVVGELHCLRPAGSTVYATLFNYATL